LAIGLVAMGAWLASSSTPVSADAPEANRVLGVQATMPFQIMIPAYLPKEFNRAGMDIQVNQSGPSGEPMVQLTYRTGQGTVLYVREWVPGNPEAEILANSRPIQTKWGRGWLLATSGTLIALWVDVGPTRVSVFTPNIDLLPSEKILAIADSLGPASSQQVFTFVVDAPTIKDMPPPPPVEIKVNEQGVQELTLVVTPGGYSPVRFSVRKGIPVRLTFRQLGQVGCGNEMIFPADPQSPTSLRLASEHDKQVLEFTPQQTGEFQYFCSHQMYRGVMTVKD
jgi:hypothetical protein